MNTRACLKYGESANTLNYMGRTRRRPFLVEKLEITELADTGQGFGKAAEGRAIFVEGAGPGDIVDVLAKRKKKSKRRKPHGFRLVSLYCERCLNVGLNVSDKVKRPKGKRPTLVNNPRRQTLSPIFLYYKV